MRARGLVADLVILNEQAASYVQDLQQSDRIALREQPGARQRARSPPAHLCRPARPHGRGHPTGRCWRWRASCCTPATAPSSIRSSAPSAEALAARDALRAVADTSGRHGDGGSSGTRIAARSHGSPSGAISPPDGSGLELWNGFGGFADNGRDYVVRLAGTRSTPQPWINVIANASFGFRTSAEGASFTWSRNSRDFQLTPWSNDPVSNRPGEAFYVSDHASRKLLLAFRRGRARSGGDLRGPRTAGRQHLPGHAWNGVARTDADRRSEGFGEDSPRLKLRNTGSLAAKFSGYAYAEWVLGNNRALSAPNIVPSLDAETGALLARNPYSAGFLRPRRLPGAPTTRRSR